MRTPVVILTLLLVCLLSFSISCGCGDDDDDDSGGATDDDADDDLDDDAADDDVDDDADDDDDVETEYGACCVDEACAVTTYDDCLGSWQGPDTTCDPNPCGDDDLDDDADDDVNDDADDDDADDDVDDDADDDFDDDVDDDINDDVDDDVDDDTVDDDVDDCEGEQVNNGPLDEDNDGDGYSEAIGDCNDAVNAVNPYATEVFDGADNNCDGVIDEGFDEDCDGYLMETLGGDDCNDNDWQINPGASDDGLALIDFNCDGLIGDAASGDADADGFAALGTSGGIVDCDDNDATIFPGNAPLDDPVACMRDEDFDDYGDDQAIAPVIAGTDCDDADSFINPGVPELPDDGIDQNCNSIDLLLSDDTGVFVATTGNDNNAGTMAAPKLTINAGAHLASLTRKSVFVAQGEYNEDVETEVSLFGGYESTAWTRNIEGYLTTISADTSVAVTVGDEEEPNPWWGDDWDDDDWGEARAENANPVAIQGFTIDGVFNSGTATLANNTINGRSGSGSSYGVRNSGTATLLNNTIGGGSESSESFGVYNYGGTATLANNTIDGGSGSTSYGVSSGGTATLTNNTINGGSGSEGSYGVYNSNHGTATLANNTIDGGSGSSSCGVRSGGTATLANNTIDGGSGSGSNYGVFNVGTATLVNNTIDGGSGSYSKGLYNAYGTATLANNTIDGVVIADGTATLVNNDIWGADMDCMIYYSSVCEAETIAEVNACAWIGCTEASGNISADPLFDVDGYHLTASSPCKDTGIDPVTWYTGILADYDFDGDARPYGAGWDIGVDEWTP
jgi:Putative metal-binding motif